MIEATWREKVKRPTFHGVCPWPLRSFVIDTKFLLTWTLEKSHTQRNETTIL
jgi:hypothetical protein